MQDALTCFAPAAFGEAHAQALYATVAEDVDWRVSDWDVPAWHELSDAARERWRLISRAVLETAMRNSALRP